MNYYSNGWFIRRQNFLGQTVSENSFVTHVYILYIHIFTFMKRTFWLLNCYISLHLAILRKITPTIIRKSQFP